jgi:hypothetical protein
MTKSFSVIAHKAKLGATVRDVRVVEKNRATTWETRKQGITILQSWVAHYLNTGVNAILAGVPTNSKPPYKYAVFVQEGFLTDIPDDNE